MSPSTSDRSHPSGRATVDAFVKHGAKVVAVDVNLPTGPGAAPFPKHNVEFLRGSVTWVAAGSDIAHS